MSNIFYLILKLAQKILRIVLFPMQLVPQNLDPLGRSYDHFTRNTCFRLVIGLVKNLIFHRVYLRKYNNQEAKINTTCTLICLLNNLQVFPSESAPKKIIEKIPR
jgi:hypothetical protein